MEDYSKLFKEVLLDNTYTIVKSGLHSNDIIAGGFPANAALAKRDDTTPVINDVDVFLQVPEQAGGGYISRVSGRIPNCRTKHPVPMRGEAEIESYMTRIFIKNGAYRLIAAYPGEINYVVVQGKGNLAPMDLIQGFDLNVTQCAIFNNQLVMTQAFQHAMETNEMYAVSMYTPFHTLIRAERKAMELKVAYDRKKLVTEVMYMLASSDISESLTSPNPLTKEEGIIKLVEGGPTLLFGYKYMERFRNSPGLQEYFTLGTVRMLKSLPTTVTHVRPMEEVVAMVNNSGSYASALAMKDRYTSGPWTLIPKEPALELLDKAVLDELKIKLKISCLRKAYNQEIGRIFLPTYRKLIGGEI